MKAAGYRHLQRGVSLIEIMVSMVIGLVVVGAVLVSYLGAGVSGKQQSAYLQMTEDAQIAFSVIGRELMSAGYARPVTWIGGTSTFARTFTGGTPDNVVHGCDTGFADPAANSLACGTSTSAAISVAYEADTVTTVVTASGLPSDCLGGTLTAQTTAVSPTVTVSFYVARNRYYVESSAAGVPELRCAPAGGVGQALVDNVESMAISYGEAVAAAPRQVVRYVPAASVVDWGLVVSARICVVMRSAEPVLTQEDLDVRNTYLNCDQTATALPDRRARRAFFTTLTLRNRMAF